MIRKLVMAGMLVTFLSATTLVFAEDVVVTANGTKYHKEICRLLKNNQNVTKLDKKKAIEGEYGPCKRCYSEDVAPEEQQMKTKQSN